MIELQNINEDARRMMFDRLNTGGSKLSEMEKRRGTSQSKFLQFVDEIARENLVVNLTPLPTSKLNRREREEYVLRFYAYLYNYQSFVKSVQKFLKESIQLIEHDFVHNEPQLREILFNTFNFVHSNFKSGFKRNSTVSIVSRVRYEAISVGCALAIQQNPSIANKTDVNTSWAFEDEFLSMIRSDASNSKPKVISRIEYVRDKILEAT